MVLSDFLFSSEGAKYKKSFKFSDELKCNSPAPPITASKFVVTFTPLVTPDEHIPAVTGLNKRIRESNSPYKFSHHFIFEVWTTDIIIGGELWTNILLSLACVVVVTLLLLCNLTVCLTVVTMVAMTLTNVVGYLHYWDSTIDIMSSIAVVLSIGLSVDYSVHIGHAYLVAEGEISDKTKSESEVDCSGKKT